VARGGNRTARGTRLCNTHMTIVTYARCANTHPHTHACALIQKTKTTYKCTHTCAYACMGAHTRTNMHAQTGQARGRFDTNMHTQTCTHKQDERECDLTRKKPPAMNGECWVSPLSDYCNTLQHTATHHEWQMMLLLSSSLFLSALSTANGGSLLFLITTSNCKTLQHTARRCHTLQHTATRHEWRLMGLFTF